MSSGARFVWNTRYFHIAKPGEKHSKYAKTKQEVINLVDYVATREGVSYNIENDINEASATSAQKEAIDDLRDKFQEEGINPKVYSEYDNYKSNPTRKNASELITRLSDEILTNDAFDSTARAKANSAMEIVDRYDPEKRQATEKQKSLINELINTLVPEEEKQEAYLKEILEYRDYKEAPTIKNASELINYLAEQVKMSDLFFDEAANLVEYAAKRPGAVKVGEHGLFSSEDNVDLEKAKEEISTHEGNIWTHILSLRREDADRLGYDSQEPWKNLVKSKLDTLAETHQINIKDLRWNAAMHNTGHHPHIHLFVFSADPTKGYFSEKVNKSIRKCKSEFATQIFKDDRLNDYVQKGIFKNELNEQSQEIIDKLLDDPTGLYSKEQLKDITNKMLELSSKLPTHGKNEYGFMKGPVKELVNEIQKQLVNENPLLSKLYMQYCEHKYNIEKTYVKNPKEAPIESNKDFITIKNMILKQAENLRNNIELNQTVKNSLIEEINDDSDNNIQIESANAEYNPVHETGNTTTEVSPRGTDEIENIVINVSPGDTDGIENTTTEVSPGGTYGIDSINIENYEKLMSDYTPAKQEHVERMINYCIEQHKDILEDDKPDVKRFKALSIISENLDARNGDICFELANCYEFGIGTEKDSSLAMMWYGIASDQFNHGMASYRLGQMYLYGADNIEVDKELGNEYCKKAFYTFKMEIKNSAFFDAIEENIDDIKYYPEVSKEDAYKEFLMCRMYLKGEGVEQDNYKASEVFELASENSAYNIGKMHLEGNGTEKNIDEAVKWLHKATL
ncbi:MAG: SEL1-like repeat protein, partial [Ruminococcus sp.]|nr:SEL1-like repeat protein [Ruminococcus sp.]